MELLKTDILQRLKTLKEKIDTLGDYCTPNADKLVNFCYEYEDIINQTEITMATIYGYEGVRGDCEHASINPDKENSYSSIKDYYNRGKRHLQRNVNISIKQFDEK